MNKLSDLKFDNFEPLIIQDCNWKTIWVNPDIADIAVFDPETGYDDQVHRIFLTSARGKQLLHLLVKSDMLDNMWAEVFEKYFDEETDTFKPYDELLRTTFDKLKVELEIVLLEDVWSPGGEQFCFTKIGKKVGKLFEQARNIQISPDCALTTDGKTYWYDT